jgi:hypothetical protein
MSKHKLVVTTNFHLTNTTLDPWFWTIFFVLKAHAYTTGKPGGGRFTVIRFGPYCAFLFSKARYSTHFATHAVFYYPGLKKRTHAFTICELKSRTYRAAALQSTFFPKTMHSILSEMA